MPHRLPPSVICQVAAHHQPIPHGQGEYLVRVRVREQLLDRTVDEESVVLEEHGERGGEEKQGQAAWTAAAGGEAR